MSAMFCLSLIEEAFYYVYCLVGRFDCRVPFTVPVKLQPPLRRNGQGRSRLPLPVRSGLEIRQCDLLSAR